MKKTTSAYETYNLEMIGEMDPEPFFKHRKEIARIIKKAEESEISPTQHEKLFEVCVDAFLLGLREGMNTKKGE